MNEMKLPRRTSNAVDFRGDDLARHLAMRLERVSGEEKPDGDYLLNEDFRDHIVAQGKKPAAVLISIVERAEGLNLILTKRTEQLKSHSGQIALPGGKIDSGDESAIAAALREAEEEIGLPPANVEILGQMPDYLSGSGYRIAPIVGFVRKAVDLVANPHEVDEIFEVPLDFMMDQKNHAIGSIFYKERERYYYEIYWQNYRIWGVTAGILRSFQERIFPT